MMQMLRWNGQPARFRRQLAAVGNGGQVARHNGLVARSTNDMSQKPVTRGKGGLSF
jgi:hypothetical protein